MKNTTSTQDKIINEMDGWSKLSDYLASLLEIMGELDDELTEAKSTISDLQTEIIELKEARDLT